MGTDSGSTVRGQERVDATARSVVECAAGAVVALAPDHTVLLWNPAAEQMFGWSAADVAGREPAIVPAELRAEHNGMLEHARAGDPVTFITRRVHRDGTLIDVRADASALRDAEGRPSGWVIVYQRPGPDEAAHQRAAERARAHERAVVDASADGIAVLDAGGLVQQWNPAAQRLAGVSAEDVTGKPTPFPLPEPGAKLTHRLDNGRWLDVLCTGLAGSDQLVLDFRDVTVAKELEEAKDLFLATTSHELRTPITVVQGYASTLSRRWDKIGDVDRRAAVETIAERAGSLGRLVEQLLLGSRVGADQLTVSNGPFDLADLLRRAVEMFRTLSARHVLKTEIAAHLPEAHGDPMATDIIIGQLLENAFKYSPAGGTVTVRARTVQGPAIEVSVADEGIGIAPGDHERIFDRFVQGDAGDRRRFGGVGLGLYIVRRLARAQNGDVHAHSRPGGGAIMCLDLQLAERQHRLR